MSHFENFLKASQAYADLHGIKHLPQKPKTHVAIATYMNSCLHMVQALELVLDGAHILRNAGGRAANDITRSLMISQQQLGTCEIVVLHHADCGAQSLTNGTFAAQLERDLGVDVHDKDFLPLFDVEKSVHEDIAILRNSPLTPEDIVISGTVYDTGTGRMRKIK